MGDHTRNSGAAIFFFFCPSYIHYSYSSFQTKLSNLTQNLLIYILLLLLFSLLSLLVTPQHLPYYLYTLGYAARARTNQKKKISQPPHNLLQNPPNLYLNNHCFFRLQIWHTYITSLYILPHLTPNTLLHRSLKYNTPYYINHQPPPTLNNIATLYNH